MFELRVCGVKEAGDLIQAGWPTRVLSVVSPTLELQWTHGNHQAVRVHDIEQEIGPGWVLPRDEHLDQALAFTADLNDHDRLIVHCRYGIGRSTAVAIGVCIQQGMEPEAAYRHVEMIRDFLLPNAAIIELIDRRFGLNNALVGLVSRERRSRMRAMLGVSASIDSRDDVLAMKSILEDHAKSRIGS